MAWLSWLVRVTKRLQMFTPRTIVIVYFYITVCQKSQTSKDMIAHNFHATAGKNISIRGMKVNQNSKVMNHKTKTMS